MVSTGDVATFQIGKHGMLLPVVEMHAYPNMRTHLYFRQTWPGFPYMHESTCGVVPGHQGQGSEDNAGKKSVLLQCWPIRHEETPNQRIRVEMERVPDRLSDNDSAATHLWFSPGLLGAVLKCSLAHQVKCRCLNLPAGVALDASGDRVPTI
jgi:hypothetical protein